MGKLVKNGNKGNGKMPKKDKIIFGVLLAVGMIPLLLMIFLIFMLVGF